MKKHDLFSNLLDSSNHSLRKCQKIALNDISNWLDKPDLSSHLVCMPTGTGKTGVIAISSLLLTEKDVLIVTPWDGLRSQMVSHLKNKFWKDSHIKCPDDFEALPFSGKDLEKKIQKVDKKTLWVTTFQGLWTISNNEKLFSKLKEKLDLVIIDEGHYEPAIWWGRAVKSLEKKTLLLTATPYRNDLKYFRIDKDSVTHYKYKSGIDDSIIRDVKPIPLGEENSNSIKSIIDAIENIWSKKEKRKLAHPHPRLIVCCENFDSVKEYTIKLRNKNINALGIHYRATKKHISKKYLRFFKNEVPKNPENEEADVWVHEKMLTEGLDYAPFCAIVITWNMKNDRRLIQQIGRIVRRDKNDKNNFAYVYELKETGVKNTWETFLEFENNFNVVTSEHFRAFLDNYLSKQPPIEYFGGRFRKRLVPNEINPKIARTEILTLPSVIVRTVDDKFDFVKFINEITDALQLEDYIAIGPEINSPVVISKDIEKEKYALWLYHRFSNSKTLLLHSAYEIKISALCVILKPPFLFLTDTDSFIPVETLDQFTIPIDLSKLRKAFAKGFIPSQVQLKNSLPHQSVIRGTVRSGPNLAQVPNTLSESKYVCRNVRGKHEKGLRRYISFNTSRISDDLPDINRNKMCLDDLIKWCNDLSITLISDGIENPFFFRFAKIVEYKGEVIPRYGFLDFWSGDFELIDEENKILEPLDAVFEIISQGLSEKLGVNTYTFRISGMKNTQLITAEISMFWKKDKFHFSSVSTNGLTIRERSESLDQGDTTFKNIDIASFCMRKHGDLFISLYSSNLIYNSGTFYEVDPGKNYADISGYFYHLPEIDKKGLPEKNPKGKRTSKTWIKKSLFGIISSNKVINREFGDEPDLVLCDDGAGEICDFIIVNFKLTKIVLIHCKSKPRLKSNIEFRAVSELQEVISQASKNLVYLSGRSDYPGHIEEWDTTSLVHGYSVKRIVKKSKLIPTKKDLWNKIRDEILLSRMSTKELWIVSGGTISKEWISNELKKCQDSTSNLACLFHMVDGLGSSCIEANISLKIFCNK